MNIREAIETMLGRSAFGSVAVENIPASDLELEVGPVQVCSASGPDDVPGRLFCHAGDGLVLASWKIAGPNQWWFSLIIENGPARRWDAINAKHDYKAPAEIGRRPSERLVLAVTS